MSRWSGAACRRRFLPVAIVVVAIAAPTALAAVVLAAPGDSSTVFQARINNAKGGKSGPKCANTLSDMGVATQADQVALAGGGSFLAVVAAPDGTVLIGDGSWLRMANSRDWSHLTTVAGKPGVPADFNRPLALESSDPLQIGLVIRGLAVDPTGRYAYIADLTPSGLRILRLELKPASGAAAKVELLASDPADAGSGGPSSLAIDGSGNVYVAQGATFANARSARIGIVTAGGHISEKIALPEDNDYGVNDVATDAAGNIYVAHPNGSVQQYDRQGSLVRTLGVTLTKNAATGRIAVDLQGKLLVAGSGSDGKLYQVDLGDSGSVRPFSLGQPFYMRGLSIQSGNPPAVYGFDYVQCSIKRVEPLGPATPPSSVTQTTATTAPPADTNKGNANTGSGSPVFNAAPKALDAPTVQSSGNSGSENTGLAGSGDGGASGSGVGDPGSASQFFGGGRGDSLFGSGFDGVFNFSPPGGTPNQAGLFGVDGTQFGGPGANSVTGAVAPPPVGPPAPGPSPGPLGQVGGGPPPFGGGPLNPSPGLGVAPGQPSQAATRYAMVRHDGGTNPVPIGLFGVGGCMLLFSLRLGAKRGGAGGARQAPARSPARAWAVGR